MYFRLLFAALVALGLAGTASAQNTAQPVITGYLTTSGCPSTALTPCFVQYGVGGGGGGGGSVTQGTTPWVDDITQWANVALGAPSNYGTSPGAVTVPGVNAFVTNVPAVTLNAGSAIAGKFGIDQTTPGTTNGVQVNAALPAGTNLLGKTGIDQTTDGTTNGVRLTTQYPAGAVAETASTTGTTGATTATLATNTGQTTFICGFSIRANATAAATNNATVTGTITATMNFTQWTAPLANGLGVTEMIFTPCVPASTTNTSIAVISGAPGSGGVVSVSAWGFLK